MAADASAPDEPLLPALHLPGGKSVAQAADPPCHRLLLAARGSHVRDRLHVAWSQNAWDGVSRAASTATAPVKGQAGCTCTCTAAATAAQPAHAVRLDDSTPLAAVTCPPFSDLR